MREKDKELLKNTLKNAQNAGVVLFIDGEEASPNQIVKKCVGEENVYMADYVLDEKGVLKELRYDKITCWK